ncbi:MAG: hypothetical protein ATN36_00450 [Epulopiscium sp. Nele67-Bin005]|nr:MAG: hypothetical protein ATN36_00450 [Epulopiscium sp. Nele67-Bin005]
MLEDEPEVNTEQPKTPSKLYLILGALTGMFLGLTVGTNIYTYQLQQQDSKYNPAKIFAIDQLVGFQYFEASELEDRVEGIFRGYISSLEDSEATYLTSEEVATYEAELNGTYVGAGFHFTWGISGQYLVITEVIENSPADIAGLEVGDYITQIDDDLAKLSNSTILYKKLTYSGEDAVLYTIKKNNTEEIIKIPIIPTVLQVDYITSIKVDEDIVCITIDRLVNGSATEIEKLILEYQNEGINNFILDVRTVTQAEFEEVVNLTDLFIEDGELFSTVNKATEVKTYHATPKYTPTNLVFLTSTSTKGSMEAMLGTLQLQGLATIIGSQTTGFGLVQDLIKLNDGSGIIVSSAVLLLPNGDNLNGTGITPDIKVSLGSAYTFDFMTKGEANLELDAQLQEAIKFFK